MRVDGSDRVINDLSEEFAIIDTVEVLREPDVGALSTCESHFAPGGCFDAGH